MINLRKQLKRYTGLSYSQLKQDALALIVNNNIKKGFFVEFGGHDGITNSNTYLLEKHFNWSGIVCEPSRSVYEKLKMNRNSIVENLAVFDTTGKSIQFKETTDDIQLSGIFDYLPEDALSKSRINGIEYLVSTITLDDLLDKHNAPSIINYLSIDTEGTEYEIIKDFNFKKRRIELITIEHNFNIKRRNLIQEILNDNGFVRILTEISQFDDWYIRKENLGKFI